MSLSVVRYFSPLPTKSSEEGPFKVLYNYRKTKLLGKIRSERKQKMERQKMERKMMADALRREKQSLINRSMF
jgi:hypothetical protein